MRASWAYVVRTALTTIGVYTLLAVGAFAIVVTTAEPPWLASIVNAFVAATFIASAAVPAWMLSDDWPWAAPLIAVAGLKGGWALAAVLAALWRVPEIGCRYHAVADGGLPDVYCFGLLPDSESGWRALWNAPIQVDEGLILALLIAMLSRVLYVLVRRARHGPSNVAA